MRRGLTSLLCVLVASTTLLSPAVAEQLAEKPLPAPARPRADRTAALEQRVRDLEALARELRLDLKQYDRDLVTCQAGLVRDKKRLETLGQRGVPGFWINGRYLEGARPIENFRTLIDEELAKARADQAQGGKLGDYYERVMKTAATAP